MRVYLTGCRYTIQKPLMAYKCNCIIVANRNDTRFGLRELDRRTRVHVRSVGCRRDVGTPRHAPVIVE